MNGDTLTATLRRFIPPYPASQRNRQVDALKGIGIILVVLAHCIQAADPRYDDHLLFRVIFSFQMELFFFLGGYVLWDQRGRATGAYLRKNARRLFVPFLAWYAIGYLLTGSYLLYDFGAYLLQLARTVSWGLWFLWVLFVNNSVLFLVSRGMQAWKREGWEDGALILAALLLRALPSTLLGIPEIQGYFVYCVAGYLVCKYRDALIAWLPRVHILALLAFPLLVLAWKRNAPPLFYPALVQALGSAVPVKAVLSVYKYAVTFLGIGLASYGAEKMKGGRLYGGLCWLGTLTFDIYVSHGYFMIGFGQGLTRFVSSALVALGLSLALSFFILRPWRPLRVLFLGQD